MVVLPSDITLTSTLISIETKQVTGSIRGDISRHIFAGTMIPDRNMLDTQPSPRGWHRGAKKYIEDED
jgi:hypothetical protein